MIAHWTFVSPVRMRWMQNMTYYRGAAIHLAIPGNGGSRDAGGLQIRLDCVGAGCQGKKNGVARVSRPRKNGANSIVRRKAQALRYWVDKGPPVMSLRPRKSLPLSTPGAHLFRCLLVAFVLSPLSTPSAICGTTAPMQIKSALIIGNAQYHYVPPHQNPINDAQDICENLRSLGYRTYCYTDVRTRSQLKSIIQDYIETVVQNSVSVIFYAGHAVQISGTNYLIPTDANIQDGPSIIRESVGLNFLMTQLKQTQPFLNIVILDACRNNPLHSTALPQELAQITDIPHSTVVMYATAEDDLAMDGKGRNGMLTKHLLIHLKDDGSIDDLFSQVSLGVQSDTTALGHTQTPMLSKNFADQYYMVRPTDMELMQRDRQLQEQRIQDLELQAAAGDRSAIAAWKAAKAESEKMAAAIRIRDEDAKRAEIRARDLVVPPAN